MNRIFFILSICGILTCISVNVLSVTGVYVPEGMGFMFLLILGMAIVFVPAVLKLQKLSKQNQKERPKGIKGMREQQQKTKSHMLSFWRPLPLGLKILVVLIAVYGFTNFFSMMYFLGDEQAAMENGQYVMESKGKIIRDITKEEYYQNKAYQASLFTGHIAIFYSFGMIFHFPRKKSN